MTCLKLVEEVLILFLTSNLLKRYTDFQKNRHVIYTALQKLQELSYSIPQVQKMLNWHERQKQKILNEISQLGYANCI